MARFNRRQWLTIFVFAVADFCAACCVSLQSPFYPQEAEKKGATSTEYGLVFGIFELTVFIVSPLIGKNLSRFGAKRVFNIGILTTGTCCILFGLLDRVEGRGAFVALSFLIRIVEAVGNSGFLNASFSIIAKEFPDLVATMFATLETFFGIGLIVGPTVGGALYQAGGYMLPFAILGGLLISAAVMTYFALPSKYDEREGMPQQTQEKGLWDLIKIPPITLAAYSILCTSLSIAFIQATLEPHLRQFKLSPVSMGAMFVVNGGIYAISAPFWGHLCDKKLPPIIVTLFGSVFIAIAFLFMGPAPFIPMETSLGLCIAMLLIHGLGFAAQLVAAFSSAHTEAIGSGFPDNLQTYALVSGLWTTTFALGAFIGPSLGGLLMDYYKFPNASLFVFATQASVLILTLCYIVYRKFHDREGRRKTEYTPITDVVTDNGFSSSENLSSDDGGTDFGVEAMATTSPDSGSFTDHYDIIDVSEENNKDSSKLQAHNIRRRIPSSSRTRNGLSVGGSGAPIFSASPLDPSPISLLGGYMGISVPSTMNDIFEEAQDNFASGHADERAPLLGSKTTS